MSRKLTAREKIDRFEGEWSSDDGLTPAQREQYVSRLEHDLDSDSTVDDQASDASVHVTSGREFPTTLAWSDDDDDAEGNTGVGIKRKRTPPKKNGSRKKPKKGKAVGQEDDDPGTADLPDYVKTRRRAFDQSTPDEDSVAGLYTPPTFDEVDFSDDENMESLKEKPVLKSLWPCAPYEDIPLETSLGVIPAPIAQWLRKYQVEGVAFLHELFVYQKGGILGDDMGLGKTIQVIACLTVAFGKTADERDAKRMRKMRRAPSKPWYPRVLIVCPGGLMDNWTSEFEKWGWWNVGRFHGTPEDKENALTAAKSGRLEIMITTYTTYRLNKDTLNTVEWDCVIADECHQIKAMTSATLKAMNEVNALCRIGLTGTAIQNGYEELWTLLNWTNPGRFGAMSTWKTVISEPLRIGQAYDATIPQLAKARKTAEKLVRNLLPEFFLRRMKSLIADQLPKKSDRVVFCPLTDKQAEAYENFIGSDMIECIKASTEPCSCGSGKKAGWCCGQFLPGQSETDDNRWQKVVFPCIAALQKLSNHLATLIPSSSESEEKQRKDRRLLKTALPDDWKDLCERRDHIGHLANVDFCGKWKILRKLLQFWHSAGDKVLVFSHSVRLLKMLKLLFTTATDYNVSYLDGTMALEERSDAVNRFNSDPKEFVFLISTRAGGVGLNIVSANKVVIVDPNWNPSHDLQAQDRAYRIGQQRDVEVFRLVSAGTIEEIVYARQIYKQQQANIGYTGSTERRYFKGVQSDKDKKGEIFGLTNLFSYQGEQIVLRDIVNRTNIAESKAGVQVVGLDLESIATEDDDNDPLRGDYNNEEDDAMSQLAAMIEDGEEALLDGRRKKKKTNTPHKTDPIQAILRSAGVEYTHENSEVIGSSKVEARLSKRAMEAGGDVSMADEHVFATSQSQRNHGGTEDDMGHEDHEGNASDDQDNEGECRNGSSRIAFKYKPPEDVRRRQFCTMAETFGYSTVEFAFLVEGWTQAERRSCLERFYRLQREKAAQ